MKDRIDLAHDEETTLQEVKDAVRRFAEERSWQQFHNLKNLAVAISTEAAELMAHFRWIDDISSNAIMDDSKVAQEIRHEVADVFLLLAEFAEVASIDMSQAVVDKLRINARRYPVAKARGSPAKYTDL